MGSYRIVVGIDGSQSGSRALSWAARQARAHEGSVRAVMVYDWTTAGSALLGGRSPVEERRRVEDYLDGVVSGVRREYPGVSIVAGTGSGAPGRTLAEAADGADLLVVGSHGHGRLHQAVLGSVSEVCVRLARCPVVVIPTPHEYADASAEHMRREGSADAKSADA